VLAAALLSAARPTPARGDGLSTTAATTYQLSNTSPAGTTPVTQVVANVIPPGTIVPTSPSVSPLTILPGSFGFDQENLKVLLGAGTSPSGSPLQALALDFGAGGFQPGGVLNFGLSLDKTFQGAPELLLPATSSGLSITEVPAASTPTPGGGGTTPTQIPEPMSLVLWSTLAGLAWMRVRGLRRARP
jgi:hypothetical protein